MEGNLSSAGEEQVDYNTHTIVPFSPARLAGWLAHTKYDKSNFTSIPFPPRRPSLGSEWAPPHPILGILQERSGAPEPLLAWTDPDVVRRGRLPFRFCSWMQPCPRPLELRHADGTVSRLRTKPSRFPFSRRWPFMVGGNRRRTSPSKLGPSPTKKKNLSPIKATTPTGLLLPRAPLRSAPSRCDHFVSRQDPRIGIRIHIPARKEGHPRRTISWFGCCDGTPGG